MDKNQIHANTRTKQEYNCYNKKVERDEWQFLRIIHSIFMIQEYLCSSFYL